MTENLPSTAPATTPSAGNISPAEAQFWREWADKAPGLLRESVSHVNRAADRAGFGKIMAIGVGAALGIASFTRAVPGRWKWLSGATAGLAGIAGLAMWQTQTNVCSAAASTLHYADELERDASLKQRLATYLSTCITAQDIQEHGLDRSVERAAMDFAAIPKTLNNYAAGVVGVDNGQAKGGLYVGSPIPGMMF